MGPRIVFSVNQNVQHNRGVYAFRTYQHLAPEDRSRIDQLNPGPAHDIPTWQVARATSAAPTYFKEMKIRQTIHLDGGFGNANNPTRFAWSEVNQMNGDNPKATALTLSIGTGLPRRVRFRNDRYIGKWIAYFKFMAHIAADSEEAHLAMLHHHRDLSRSENYYRFNVDAGLEDIKMGEWKTRNTQAGKVYLTLDNIAAATTTYLQKPEVQERLRHFAEILVNNRRQRCQDSRWNNAAMGQKYHCTVKRCGERNTCHETHENLRHHLKEAHGLADTTAEDRINLERLIERGKILVSE
jgi:Patatin-like phospholipase